MFSVAADVIFCPLRTIRAHVTGIRKYRQGRRTQYKEIFYRTVLFLPTQVQSRQVKTTLVICIQQITHSVHNFRQGKACGQVIFYCYFNVGRTILLLPLTASKCLVVLDRVEKSASLYSSSASSAASNTFSTLLPAGEDQVPGHLELVLAGSEVCPDLG